MIKRITRKQNRKTYISWKPQNQMSIESYSFFFYNITFHHFINENMENRPTKDRTPMNKPNPQIKNRTYLRDNLILSSPDDANLARFMESSFVSFPLLNPTQCQAKNTQNSAYLFLNERCSRPPYRIHDQIVKLLVCVII